MNTNAWRVAGGLLLGIAVAGSFAGVEGQASTELYGGWVVSGWEWPAGVTAPAPQRGLFMFTESGHYSMMFVIGEERKALSDDPSDAEIAAAYNPFVANSGRYSVSGNVITYEAFVAKDPEYMSQFAPTGGDGNAQTMTYGIADGVLTLHFGEGGPMGGATATLRRPRAR